MSRPHPFSMTLAALALASGCYYIKEGEPFEDSIRQAAAGPARKRAWVLVKYWTGDAPAAASAEGCGRIDVTPLAHGVDEIPIRVASVPDEGDFSRAAPGGPHESILIREGDSGFLAIARGERVRRFTFRGQLFGDGAGTGSTPLPVEGGFEISARVLRDGRIAVTLAPVFVGVKLGGEAAGEAASGAVRAGSRANELRVEELGFGLPVEEGQAVMLWAWPPPENEVMRALFMGPSNGGHAQPRVDHQGGDNGEAGLPMRALWFQIEVVR